MNSTANGLNVIGCCIGTTVKWTSKYMLCWKRYLMESNLFYNKLDWSGFGRSPLSLIVSNTHITHVFLFRPGGRGWCGYWEVTRAPLIARVPSLIMFRFMTSHTMASTWLSPTFCVSYWFISAVFRWMSTMTPLWFVNVSKWYVSFISILIIRVWGTLYLLPAVIVAIMGWYATFWFIILADLWVVVGVIIGRE